MSTTETATQSDLSIVKEPTTPKTSAIVNEAKADPDASNSEIAARVEDRIGEDVSASWVSRVRRDYLSESGAETDAPEPDVDDGTETAIDAIRKTHRSVEALRDDVRQTNERLDRIEAMLAGELTDDVIRAVLERFDIRVDERRD